jgi:hypothetical protein
MLKPEILAPEKCSQCDGEELTRIDEFTKHDTDDSILYYGESWQCAFCNTITTLEVPPWQEV